MIWIKPTRAGFISASQINMAKFSVSSSSMAQVILWKISFAREQRTTARLARVKGFNKKQLRRGNKQILKMLPLRIRTAVDKYKKQHKLDEQEDEPELDETPSTSQINSVSWRFRAPSQPPNAKTFEEDLNSAGHPVINFDLLLRNFVAAQFPEERVSYEQQIKVSQLRDILNPLNQLFPPRFVPSNVLM
ncbi:hypothetical protein B0H14DRAFT_2556108 [Mycena olivaceomarginata]|nr:hypothetical protein B0H14DRAFT_2556108 [Mycena olivaceomarginata]